MNSSITIREKVQHRKRTRYDSDIVIGKNTRVIQRYRIQYVHAFTVRTVQRGRENFTLLYTKGFRTLILPKNLF